MFASHSEVNHCYEEAESLHSSFLGQKQAQDAFLISLRSVSLLKKFLIEYRKYPRWLCLLFLALWFVLKTFVIPLQPIRRKTNMALCESFILCFLSSWMRCIDHYLKAYLITFSLTSKLIRNILHRFVFSTLVFVNVMKSRLLYLFYDAIANASILSRMALANAKTYRLLADSRQLTEHFDFKGARTMPREVEKDCWEAPETHHLSKPNADCNSASCSRPEWLCWFRYE